MTSFLGWVIIILIFASIGMGLLYPGYRAARRSYPESRHLWWVYCIAAAVCGVALWLLLPVVVHQLFGRMAR
jgi:hypothetical protein